MQQKPIRHLNLETLDLKGLEQKRNDIDACIRSARNQDTVDKYTEQLVVVTELINKTMYWVLSWPTSTEWEE